MTESDEFSDSSLAYKSIYAVPTYLCPQPGRHLCCNYMFNAIISLTFVLSFLCLPCDMYFKSSFVSIKGIQQ